MEVLKGYFLGAKMIDRSMVLCFRDESLGLHYGTWENWNPKEYVIFDPKDRTDVLEMLVYGLKDGDRRIKFSGLPKVSDSLQYPKYPELSPMEVVLSDFRDRTRLFKALNRAKKDEDMYVNVSPDGTNPRSHEEAFCKVMKMLWQHEFEFEAGDAVSETPDGSPIRELKQIAATGRKNARIGKVAFDIETNVKNWKSVSYSYSALVPKPDGSYVAEHRAYIYPPDSWDGTAEEFKARYIDSIEDEEVAADAKKWDLSKIVVCANDRRDFYVRIIRDFYLNLNRKFDAIIGFNNRAYDQKEIIREMYGEGISWSEMWDGMEEELTDVGEPALTKNEFKRLRKMELTWRGKGGYKATFHPLRDDTVDMRSPFTLNVDIYKMVSRGRFMPVMFMHKRLEDFEKILPALMPESEEDESYEYEEEG